MSEKFGAKAYDMKAFLARGGHEFANGVVFPDSNIPLRDHSGLYGNSDRDVESSRADREAKAPVMERDEPELEV